MKRLVSLKTISSIISCLALVITVYCLSLLIIYVAGHPNMSLPDKLRRFPGLTDCLCLAIMALFISFRAKGGTGGYLIAIFLSCYSANNALFSTFKDTWFLRVLDDDFTSTLIGILLIYAIQYFPQHITAGQIAQSVKNKYLKGYLTWLLKPLNLWLYFFLSITGIELILSLVAGISVEIFFEIFVCLTAWLFMLVSYKESGANSRNSLLWLFWGILCYVFVVSFYVLALAFIGSQNPYITVVFKICINLVVVSTFFMSIFFASSFNTGFIIKRTIVDGLLFLIVIIAFNTMEHYVTHTINEHFGISDAFTSSLLSGVLVLIVSPLHHRLSNFLNHKLKHGNHDQH